MRPAKATTLAGFVLLLGGLAAAAAAAPGAPVIEAPALSPATAPEGHLLIRWQAPQPNGGNPSRSLRYQIQRGRSAEFVPAQVRDLGPDRATFVSGLPPGTAWFRVRAIDGAAIGPWSEPLAVEVAYPSRERTQMLLITGFVVFLATAGFILRGHHRTRSTTR